MLKLKKHPLIIILLGFTLLGSCVKKECKPTSYMEYRWEIPVSLSPAKDTFNIGDTITITSIFNDDVYEQFYGEKYQLINYNFFPFTTLRKIDSVDASTKAFESFFSSYAGLIVDSEYEYYNGSDVYGNSIAVGEYSYYDNKYELEYKIVLKQKGLFLLNHSSKLFGNDPQWGGQDFVGKCSEWEATCKIILNNNAPNNFEMLDNAYPNQYVDWVLRGGQSEFHENGGYCFYVK